MQFLRSSIINGIDGLDDTILLSILNPLGSQESKEVLVKSPIITNQKPTKILIQNPSNKKFIAKPLLNASNTKINL